MSSIVSPQSPSNETDSSGNEASSNVSFADAVEVSPLDQQATAAPTEPEPTQVEADEVTEEGCVKCGSLEPWGMSSWCPVCGFYPKLNTTVEVETPAEVIKAGLMVDSEDKSPTSELLESIPPWGWILLGGMGGVVALSVAARLTIADTTIPRGQLAVLQLVLGLVVALVGHGTAYFKAMTVSEKFGPFDILMKPVALWEPALKNLPEGAWRLWCVAWGVTASLCAVAVIGGISYSSIFDDWGAKKRAAPNLVHAITEKARQERDGGADSLEEAMNDFVGEEGLSEEERNELRAADLEKLDCLVFGYTTQGDEATDEFSMILLAAMIDEKIKFVATFQAHEISEGARQELNQRMHTLRRRRPFVQVSQAAPWVKDAHWLKPVMMCQVGFKGWTTLHKLREPVFVRLLGDVAHGQ